VHLDNYFAYFCLADKKTARKEKTDFSINRQQHNSKNETLQRTNG